MDYILYCY